MMFPTARNTLLVSALLGAGTLGVAACTSEKDTDPQKASGGATGTTGGAGNVSGGSGGGGGVGGAVGGAVACPTPTTAAITDFTYAADATSTSEARFGTFAADSFSGGTFFFPSAIQVPAPTYPVTSDVTGGNWHIRGPIGHYSGFGLYHDCKRIDASNFKGIRFTVSGNVAMGATITLAVGTAANEVSAAWKNANKAVATAPDETGFGRCTPPGTNQYDGTCASPSKVIPVTATPTVVTVLWAELIGGRPQPTVTSTEITSIAWSFPPPVGVDTAAVVPYEADITLDDLQFVP